jgi:hypothetical protein
MITATMMEAVSTPKTTVSFCKPTRRNTLEDSHQRLSHYVNIMFKNV